MFYNMCSYQGEFISLFKQKKKGGHIMCKKNFFMEMKKRRGYSEMRLLLRRSNVNFSCLGEQLLEIAIMSYLHNPNQEKEELFKTVEDNSPMPISDGETAFTLMKEALENVHTHKSEKVTNDEVVMIFISSIAEEIRISKAIEMKEVEEELNITAEERDLLISVCKRRFLKSHDTFKEVLNHVAGRNGYDDIKPMLKKLMKCMNLNTEVSTEESILKLTEVVDDALLIEKDDLIF